MSAAANAAGYLYAHGQLPVSDTNAKAARPGTAKPQAEAVKQKRTPKIEYRKRRASGGNFQGEARGQNPGVEADRT